MKSQGANEKPSRPHCSTDPSAAMRYCRDLPIASRTPAGTGPGIPHRKTSPYVTSRYGHRRGEMLPATH